MKKKVLLIIFALLDISSNAQQLYFFRTNANIDQGEYQYTELPPTQIIAYTPDQDTLLRVYRDYSDQLPFSSKATNVRGIEFYPEYNVFILKPYYGDGFDTYALYGNTPDTLIKMPTQCPEGYSVDPFLSMNIVNGQWAYQCYCNDKDAPKKDRDIAKGIDFSLSNHFDMSNSDFKDLYLTGVAVRIIVLQPNDGRMYMPIVSDIENRPVFSVELPEKYWTSNEKYSVVWVNDDHKTLVQTKRMNPTKDEDYGHFYAALYHKDNNTWSDIELKGNAPTIMTYGRWIAGVVQDKTDWDTRFFIRDKVSPGKAARDSINIENSFDEQASNGFYRPGILYLFNTETEKYIEWETQQGDSEILLVKDEIVYYRVFDAIYKVAIINGEKLGKAELLVKDRQTVPYIHWAFLRQ